ncbi:MAG TPA: class I SAM-dependent methyltransferase [Candidatus Eisenbacteria bacterium]|jgi:2-polyprenyl-3-methyl-5-hydroxy-6-metoxy-1,4-benzoquinol methylase
MPTSEHWQIPQVLDVLASERPARVLDVGAGYGKYGCLAREYASPTRVDGVDAAAPRFPVYDHFYLGDLRELSRVLPPDAPRYDLALLVDVIEHLCFRSAYRARAGARYRSLGDAAGRRQDRARALQRR